MNWYVIRHPDTGGVGVVAECALPAHRNLGWVRVSDAYPEDAKDNIDKRRYAEAIDLDAVPVGGGNTTAHSVTEETD